MMYQLTSETVKDATMMALRERIPCIEVFEWIEIANEQTVQPIMHELGLRNDGVKKDLDEEVTFPYLFVEQVDVISTEDRKNFILNEYFISVRYYVHNDPSILPRLQQNLDHMARQLELALACIIINGSPVVTFNRRSQKQNGVLHFFFNVTLEEEIIPPQASLMKDMRLLAKANVPQ